MLTNLSIPWVNISALQLIQGDLESRLAASLAQHKVPAAMLWLELTESVLLDERAGDISPRLEALRSQGHQIAIDDFGSGYSGLNLLVDYLPDVLKLDRGLIRDIQIHRPRQVVVRAIVDVCAELGIDVLAEGVETQDELRCCETLGIHLFQGYYFARPMFESLPKVDFRRVAGLPRTG